MSITGSKNGPLAEGLDSPFGVEKDCSAKARKREGPSGTQIQYFRSAESIMFYSAVSGSEPWPAKAADESLGPHRFFSGWGFRTRRFVSLSIISISRKQSGRQRGRSLRPARTHFAALGHSRPGSSTHGAPPLIRPRKPCDPVLHAPRPPRRIGSRQSVRCIRHATGGSSISGPKASPAPMRARSSSAAVGGGGGFFPQRAVYLPLMA